MAIIEQGPATDPVVDENADAPENETAADKFTRLANKRTTVALDKIRILGNLANRSIYEFTDEQVDKIERALNDEIAIIFHRFRKIKEAKRSFSL